MTNELFKNRYRIPSARAPWHDYRHGTYFVTICTKNREHSFGEITNDATGNHIMSLSEIGKNADVCWQEIPSHFPHVQTLSRVIMPNHIHGILTINPIEGTRNFASLQPGESQQNGQTRQTNNVIVPNNRFGPQSRNLASVMRGFKIGVTKFSRQNRIPFEWQPRYYEHLIRNMDELYFIMDYIENNVAKWEEDGFYG
ncbi:MAG: hypothetical protein J6X98_09295 [Bacteroidales bacterium]|nr:hypothetical protein [Bacteroidales bacterium]